MQIREPSDSQSRQEKRPGTEIQPPWELAVPLLTQLVMMLALDLYLPVGRPVRVYGYDGKGTARTFVKNLYPDRAISPASPTYSTSSAGVAVVFALIRSGDSATARQAIDFASDHHFRGAFPYVIERLQSDDPGLRQSARTFLISVAGQDYGPSPEPWRAWWHNPPRMVFGIGPIGERTVEFGLPVVLALTGIFVWGLLRLWIWVRGLPRSWAGRPPLDWAIACMLCFIVPGFAAVGLSQGMCGSFESCTFGAETISYYTSHGDVLGLEDARYGQWLFFFSGVCWLLVNAAWGMAFVVVQARRDLRWLHEHMPDVLPVLVVAWESRRQLSAEHTARERAAVADFHKASTARKLASAFIRLYSATNAIRRSSAWRNHRSLSATAREIAYVSKQKISQILFAIMTRLDKL